MGQAECELPDVSRDTAPDGEHLEHTLLQERHPWDDAPGLSQKLHKSIGTPDKTLGRAAIVKPLHSSFLFTTSFIVDSCGKSDSNYDRVVDPAPCECSP